MMAIDASASHQPTATPVPSSSQAVSQTQTRPLAPEPPSKKDTNNNNKTTKPNQNPLSRSTSPSSSTTSLSASSSSSKLGMELSGAQASQSFYFIEHLFPSKLWRILDDAERCGYDNVISWVDNGMAFQIRKCVHHVPFCCVCVSVCVV